MFLEFFGFHQQPFGVTPDPAFLYLSPAHREALGDLSAGIKEGRGFLALIAPSGMGKTTLLYQLMEDFHVSACTAFLFQTLCEPREFFQYLLRELRIDSNGLDAVGMHAKLNEILFAEMIAGRRFVLIVDEAQNLSDDVLETVRMLSNFETSHTKLLQIVLAGQPQLGEKLAQPHLLQLRQRIALLSEIEPLSEYETMRYIEHRLAVAGYSGAPIFDAEATSLIARESRGIPRSINNLCHNALGAASARGEHRVTREIAERICRKLNFGWAAERQETSPTFWELRSSRGAAALGDVPLGIETEPLDEATLNDEAGLEGEVVRIESAADAPSETLAEIARIPPNEPTWKVAKGELARIALAAEEPHMTADMSSSPFPPWSGTLEEEPKPSHTSAEILPGDIGLAAAPQDIVIEFGTSDSDQEERSPVLVRAEALAATAAITYVPAKRVHLPRWDYRATIAIGLLAAGGLAFGLAKFMEPSQARAASVSKHAQTPTDSSYSADPQDVGAAQVVTVAAMPQQTLKDVATLYLGRYDDQILSEIQLLNPSITEPDHLKAGQLIRLPLPQGTFREGAGIPEQPSSQGLNSP